MMDEKLEMKFFVQCDTQIAKQEKLVELLGRAGCYQMFIGVESFDRATLIAANKKQNRPDAYQTSFAYVKSTGLVPTSQTSLAFHKIPKNQFATIWIS